MEDKRAENSVVGLQGQHSVAAGHVSVGAVLMVLLHWLSGWVAPLGVSAGQAT
jgi:hypothetical protein